MPVLEFLTKFSTRVLELLLKMETLKVDTSPIGSYRSAPPPGISVSTVKIKIWHVIFPLEALI